MREATREPLVIIDTRLGNIQSVREAFRRIGAPIVLTTRREDVESARAIVLPGVGAFGDGMRALREHGLIEAVQAHVRMRSRPVLGICLGMQLLAEEGEEHGRYAGLGLVRGRVVRLCPRGPEDRIPNMGWCDTRIAAGSCVLFGSIRDGEAFYFAHSYHLECADAVDVAATLDFGGSTVVAAVERGDVFGVQFHPEKSQGPGLSVLAAFWNFVRDRGRA